MQSVSYELNKYFSLDNIMFNIIILQNWVFNFIMPLDGNFILEYTHNKTYSFPAALYMWDNIRLSTNYIIASHLKKDIFFSYRVI